MDILNLFGVDWKLMLAQLVNFVIVVVILWWFALKPLTATMKKRSDDINQGLVDAEAAAKKLREVESEVKAKLQTSKVEADQILDNAKKQADLNRQENIAKTKQEVANLIKKAKDQIQSEKDTMVAEAKGELAQVVVAALEKILAGTDAKDLDKKYISKVLKDLK